MNLDRYIDFPVLHSGLQLLMTKQYEESVKYELLIFLSLVGVFMLSSPAYSLSHQLLYRVWLLLYLLTKCK